MNKTLMQKLQILADGAKYDVSCSSSGAGRYNNGQIGNAHISGICHTWAADGRCVSLLKVLFTNNCEYNCAYCVNRRDNDVPRASFEPEELARLTIEFYRRNYIEGLFLSSAVEISPDYTAERILQSLVLLREKYGFSGYIHAKVIPGISPELLHRIGLAADRLSVNIEMPSEQSLKRFAPQKQASRIFAPMRQITNTLIETGSLKGPGTMFQGQKLNTAEHYLVKAAGPERKHPSVGKSVKKERSSIPLHDKTSAIDKLPQCSKTMDVAIASSPANSPARRDKPARTDTALIAAPAKTRHTDFPIDRTKKGSFASAGQTTQMIIGAGEETDQSILTTSEQLYRTFKMKRVYYSAYVPVVDSPILPGRGSAPPLRREHRIYQADWLLRFYGFTAGELFTGGHVNLDPDLDPKVTWALRNLEQFPVEINTAPYEMLMRIPGIGNRSARRILRQRRFAAVRFDDLKKLGVVIKRAKYFVLCCGRYYGERRFEPETIRNSILQMEAGLQMSMFDATGALADYNSNSISQHTDSGLMRYRADWTLAEKGERQEKLSAVGVI